MTHRDLPVARADDAAGGDELGFAKGEQLAAHQTRRMRPAKQPDHRDHGHEPRPHDRDEDDAHQDQRDGQQRVGEPHDQLVAETAGEPRDHPERGADGHVQRDRAEPDDERDPGAVDHAREDVPA